VAPVPYLARNGPLHRCARFPLPPPPLPPFSHPFSDLAVYDHLHSNDNTREILQPFVDLGWVTWVDFDVDSKYAQSEAFNRFMSTWGKRSKWHFFFDIDEFLARNETLLPAAELEEPFTTWFDRKYSGNGGVALPRLAFSSNGHYHRPEAGTLASYTEVRAIDRNFYAPKIIQQGKHRVSGDIHRATFSDDLVLVDPAGKSGEAFWEDAGSYPVYLHHYWAKSWDECVGKIKQSVRFLLSILSPFSSLRSLFSLIEEADLSSPQAFPGSWREHMGDRFCRFEMSMTEEHNTLEHHQDTSLAKFAAPLRTVAERFQRNYPTLSAADYSLSTLVTSFTSTRRQQFSTSAHSATPGTVFVIDNARGEVGFIDAILSTSQTKRSVFFTAPFLPFPSCADFPLLAATSPSPTVPTAAPPSSFPPFPPPVSTSSPSLFNIPLLPVPKSTLSAPAPSLATLGTVPRSSSSSNSLPVSARERISPAFGRRRS
jgi:hypothetical protein